MTAPIPGRVGWGLIVLVLVLVLDPLFSFGSAETKRSPGVEDENEDDDEDDWELRQSP